MHLIAEPSPMLQEGLLNTMSFIDPLPAFKVKQWQVITVLFLDALSVCRIPALTPHMTNRTMLLRKVRPLDMIFVSFVYVMMLTIDETCPKKMLSLMFGALRYGV